MINLLIINFNRRVITILSTLLLAVIFTSCFCPKKEDKHLIFICSDTMANGERIDSINVDLIDIDSSFFNFFDTIIIEEKRCPYYNDCNSGFLFTTSLIKSKSGLKEIMISSININRYDYSKCKGVFIYNNFRFVLDSLSDDEYLHITNNKIKIKYFIENKHNKRFDIDDRFSNWLFIKKNNNIECSGHYSCPK